MTAFSNDISGSLVFAVTWQLDGVEHEEIFTGRKVNPVNDLFPRGMREALEGKTIGESVSLDYAPRYCIPRHKDKLVQKLPLDRLRPKTRYGRPIIPLKGRFYPQGHINGLLDVYPDTLTPFRLIGIDDTTFTADRNHPLASIPITITATVESLVHRAEGSYGSLTHWREATCDWGPGMQAMHKGEPTQFIHADFFHQLAPDTTALVVPSLDVRAEKNITSIQKRFISPNMRVLDLGKTAPVNGTYDALVVTGQLEYMTDPIESLRQAADRLRPGAPVIVAFGDSYDENHVIQGWIDLHAFERMGLVLQFLQEAGLSGQAGTVSIRNDWRDRDDPNFLEKKGVSDSVYLVYGHKEDQSAITASDQ